MRIQKWLHHLLPSIQILWKFTGGHDLARDEDVLLGWRWGKIFSSDLHDLQGSSSWPQRVRTPGPPWPATRPDEVGNKALSNFFAFLVTLLPKNIIIGSYMSISKLKVDVFLRHSVYHVMFFLFHLMVLFSLLCYTIEWWMHLFVNY